MKKTISPYKYRRVLKMALSEQGGYLYPLPQAFVRFGFLYIRRHVKIGRANYFRINIDDL